MNTIEQANYFITLVYQDDYERLQKGEGIDLWLSEQVCIEGLAKIYGMEHSPAYASNELEFGWDSLGCYLDRT